MHIDCAIHPMNISTFFTYVSKHCLQAGNNPHRCYRFLKCKESRMNAVGCETCRNVQLSAVTVI